MDSRLNVNDEIVIGRGHNTFNSSSILSAVGLYNVKRLDDGRVFLVNDSLAWVTVSAHGPGPPLCIGFTWEFTQRAQAGYQVPFLYFVFL